MALRWTAADPCRCQKQNKRNSQTAVAGVVNVLLQKGGAVAYPDRIEIVGLIVR